MGSDNDQRAHLPAVRWGGWTLLRDAVRLLHRADPGMFRRLLVIELGIAVMVPVQLVAARWVLESILDGRRTTDVLAIAAHAAVVFGCVATVSVLMAAASSMRFRFPQKVGTAATAMLCSKMSRMRLAVLEAPDFQTRLRQTERDSSWRPALMTSDLVNITASSATLVALLVVVATVEPMIVVLCAACLGLQISRGSRSRRIVYRHLADRASAEQRLRYVASLLLSSEASKEVRGFETANFIRRRYDALADRADSALKRTARHWATPYFVGGLSSAVLASGGIIVAWWFQHSGGASSPSDLLFVAGALLLIALQGNRLAFALGHFTENVIFVRDFWWLLGHGGIERRGGCEPTDVDMASLRVRGVSFAYEGSGHVALTDVTMQARRGEIIGVIGHNGAGKSTLVKLLSNLYEPTEGSIEWGGTDSRCYDPVLLRRRISVVHQDFVRYELSAAENIGLGAVADLAEPDEIVGAARAAGVDDFLMTRPAGYDTLFGTSNTSDAGLSTGQWQRVALARAIVRTDADLLLLDEPSASLDGAGDKSLEGLLRRHAADRITLIVSHRLSTVAMADRVYLLTHGQVQSVGTHADLARSSAEYRKLFAHQAGTTELTTLGQD